MQLGRQGLVKLKTNTPDCQIGPVRLVSDWDHQIGPVRMSDWARQIGVRLTSTTQHKEIGDSPCGLSVHEPFFHELFMNHSFMKTSLFPMRGSEAM